MILEKKFILVKRIVIVFFKSLFNEKVNEKIG